MESSGFETENIIKCDSVVKIKSAELDFYINSLRVKTSQDEEINDDHRGGSDDEMGEVDDVVIDDDFLERNSLED